MPTRYLSEDTFVKVGQRWNDEAGRHAEVRGIVDDCAVMRRHGRRLFLLGLDVLEEGFAGWKLQQDQAVRMYEQLQSAKSAASRDAGEAFCDGHCTWSEHQPGCPRYDASGGVDEAMVKRADRKVSHA